jgi:hypothetical protein
MSGIQTSSLKDAVLNVSFFSSAEGTLEGTVNTSFYIILFSDNFVSLMCSLSAFAKLRKAIVICVLFVLQSTSSPASPRGITRFPLEKFSKFEM